MLVTMSTGPQVQSNGVIRPVPNNTNPHLIDLVAEATWVSCCVKSEDEANAFAIAANAWAAEHPFQLHECPFEEHIPLKAFWLNFEAGEYNCAWACYCHCAWVLKHRFETIADAAKEGEKYFDLEGVSPVFLEWIIFGDEPDGDELPDGRPLYVYDPELRIYHAEYQRSVDEYLLRGGYGRIVVEKVDSRAL